jgi:hypothetical protein
MDFQGVLLKYSITQDDTFNIDETRFQIGCLGSLLVIMHLAIKAVYLSNLDNRKMVSAVECISGGGFAIKLMIIMAGSVLIEKHFDNTIGDRVLFATSESGYSNAYLGMEWLKYFDRQTAGKKRNIGCWCLTSMGATLQTSSHITIGNTISFRSDCVREITQWVHRVGDKLPEL